jgi:hypothetical protein
MRHAVETGIAACIPIETIGAMLQIDPKTLVKYYASEISAGRTRAIPKRRLVRGRPNAWWGERRRNGLSS